MSETKKTGNGKKIAAAVVVLAVLIALAAVIYTNFAPKAIVGAKEITIEVVDNNGETTTYTVNTDAEFLRQAMEETEGLTFEGTESDYGMMVETVNGLTADYDADGAYWSFYVDNEYCNYGIGEQPVEDGQTFQIIYTVY